MLPITNDLAQRLETAEAIDAAGCAEAHCRVYAGSNAAVQAIGGGVAVFCGAESPLTHSVGIGMHGPVTEKDIDDLETFFHERHAPVIVDLCPHADATLRDLLSNRGYRILEFINVMTRSLTAHESLPEPAPSIVVRTVEPHENELYVNTVIGGFFGRELLNEQEMDLGVTLFHMPCSEAFLAFFDGQAAGGGGMSIRNKAASLFSDSTLPQFRGRGVHPAVIRARLASAQKAGCDLAIAGTAPGSPSQRNYEKLGFQVAYTKATMGLE
jgi:GNAT superfamily N-acetyltransferase